MFTTIHIILSEIDNKFGLSEEKTYKHNLISDTHFAYAYANNLKVLLGDDLHISVTVTELGCYLNIHPQYVKCTFGKVRVYVSSETHRFHAVNFGIERDTLAELKNAIETRYYAKSEDSDNGNYSAGYAYACGYFD